MDKVTMLQLDWLKDTYNVRTSDTDVQELAHSMQENGQKVPIQVYMDGPSWVVLYGHRRVAAARLLGWTEIKAIVQDAPTGDADLLISQYAENDQRKGMSYIDKANVYARLKALGMMQKEIAVRFGVSEADISLALAALRADPKLQQAIQDGRIAPSAAEPLLSQSLRTQGELVDAAVQAKTVRKVKALVNAHQQKEKLYKETHDVKDNEDDDIDPLEELAVSELDAAVEHLRLARQTPIQHPDLVRKSRPKVEELLTVAARLKKYMDGEVWSDLGDLV